MSLASTCILTHYRQSLAVVV